MLRRERLLRAGFDAWLKEHSNSARLIPGAPYVLLHSLAHLLITETSCEQFNDFSDRALVVPTLDETDAALFRI